MASAELLSADDADTDVLQWGFVQEARGGEIGPIDIGRDARGVTAVEKAVLAGIDWIHLSFLLEKAAAAPELSGSPEVIEFTQYIAQLARKYGPSWGADGVFEAITRAFTSRAAKAARSRGDSTRQDVKDAWEALVRKGVPERARAKQIATDEGRSITQVRAALRALGLYDPKNRKRG